LNSDIALDLFTILNDEPTYKGKKEIIKEFDTEILRSIVEYAYNPYKTYGIRKLEIPYECSHNSGVFSPATFKLLNSLISRELSGNAALEAVEDEMFSLSKKSAEVLKRIILKDLRCGLSIKSWNKIFSPGIIPEVAYMRCSLPHHVKLDEWSWEEGIYSQWKMDMSYASLTVTDKTKILMTRTGRLYPTQFLDHIMNHAALRPGYQYQGELVVFDKLGILERAVGNGILNSIRQGGRIPYEHQVRFIIWDIVSTDVLSGKESSPSYYSRFELLKRYFDFYDDEIPEENDSICIIPTRVVYNQADAQKHFAELTAADYEGTIIKKPKGVWANKTSKEQIKLKSEKECELECIELIEGKGKMVDTFGSMLCVSRATPQSPKVLRVKVPGSSFTERLREQIIEDWDTHWKNSIITVRFNEVTCTDGEYSLFLPRFIDKRTDDKEQADTLLEIIKL
jgi:DNA ligase-1